MSPNKTKKGAVAIQESSPGFVMIGHSYDRAKRQRTRDTYPVNEEPGPSTLKRQRSKMSSEDEDEPIPRKGASKATSSKYGSHHMRSPSFGSHNKPAELFRKDLISAMKLADSEPLQEGSYFLISDPWKQEWEKGVQVPVNMSDIVQADVKEIREKSKLGDFKIPHKLLHERADSQYKKGLHELTGMPQLAELLVRYDLDDLDVCWLEEVNFTRQELGLSQINEWNMERVMEELENQCHEKMTAVMKTEEGLGIEYDEDVVCDVCRSPESEDTNEMVFCDGCDICIHQACYGIQSIPEGSWLCRTCALGIKPRCILCPQTGGAMKSTRSGTKWAHVSCALWIPEVSIGIPEKMEPITKISNIPPSRWALCCSLCKERVGACIQCSVKTCKTAFHVTCGFQNGLEMKTVLDENDEADGVKLKAYCTKHTKKRERGQSESDVDSPRKEGPPTPKKELTQQEKANLRAKKLKQLEEEFYKVVDVADVAHVLQLDEEIVDLIYVYWKLKRKSNWDRPLLTPRREEAEMLEKQQEDSLVARMKMFVHLRQDLERVRNLCYMIGKREKMKRQFFRYKEYVFAGMVRVLLDKHLNLSDSDVEGITANYHFDSIYDDYGHSFPQLMDYQSAEETTEGDDSTLKTPGKGRVIEDAAESGDDSAQQDVGVLTSDITTKMDEESLRMLARGERWSGEFVRTGFFKRRRHRKWIRGPLGSLSRLSAKCGSQREVKAGAIEAETTDKEDSTHAVSADESEVDRPVIVKKEILDEGVHKGKNGEANLPPIPKIVVVSPKGKITEKLRIRRKKRQRGRKPWHVKKLHHAEIAAKIGLVGDEEVKEMGCEEVRDVGETMNDASECEEALVTAEDAQAVAVEVVVSTEHDNDNLGEDVESMTDPEPDCPVVSLPAGSPEVAASFEAASESKQSRRERSRHRKRIARSERPQAAHEDPSMKVQPDESGLLVQPRVLGIDKYPGKKKKVDNVFVEGKKEQHDQLELAERELEPDVKVESSISSRQRRKTLHQTRLNMNKALSALAESSDDDFVSPKSMVTTNFARRRSHIKQERRQSLQDPKQSDEESSKDEEKQEREEKEAAEEGLSDGINTVTLCHPQQPADGISDQTLPRLRTASIRPELNGLLRKSKLTVKESVKEKVQNRLLKSRHRWRTNSNGLHNGSQIKVDSFCKSFAGGKNQDSSETIEKQVSKNRVLHEMNPERDYCAEKNIFGAHYTPKGSLSGYKIPKRTSNSSLPTTPTSPLQSVPSAACVGSVVERACKELGPDLQPTRRRLDSSLESKSSVRKVFRLHHPLDVDATASSVAGHSDSNHFTMETVSNCHGYRTNHSPLSSEGSNGNHALHSDSRESTPRRVTRSQLTDDLVENAPSSPRTLVNGGGGGGGSSAKMRLKESWLRAAHFST